MSDKLIANKCSYDFYRTFFDQLEICTSPAKTICKTEIQFVLSAKVLYNYTNMHFLILNNCRLLVEALLMTGSDLCASAKPWDLQMQTVEVIYDEFYNQVCKL